VRKEILMTKSSWRAAGPGWGSFKSLHSPQISRERSTAIRRYRREGWMGAILDATEASIGEGGYEGDARRAVLLRSSCALSPRRNYPPIQRRLE